MYTLLETAMHHLIDALDLLGSENVREMRFLEEFILPADWDLQRAKKEVEFAYNAVYEALKEMKQSELDK